MRNFYIICMMIFGVSTLMFFKSGQDDIKDCVTPLTKAVDAEGVQRALDNQCKRLKAQAQVAEAFLNAIAK